MKQFADMLKGNTTLTFLNMACESIMCFVYAVFPICLFILKQTRLLMIFVQNILRKHWVWTLHWLRWLSSVSELCLLLFFSIFWKWFEKGNDFGHDAIKYIADMVKVNTTLNSIDFSSELSLLIFLNCIWKIEK